MYSMQQAAQLRDVHFHNSGKPNQFIKNISIFNKNSAYDILFPAFRTYLKIGKVS